MDIGLDTRKEQSEAYLQAFKAANRELHELRKRAFDLKVKLAALEAEIDKKLMVAKGLADILAQEGNASLNRELQKFSKGPGHSARTSVAYDAVRKILADIGRLRGQDQLKTADVLREIKTQKIGVEPKAVYNALNYLEKTGRLKRVSRGHYVVRDGGYAVHSEHEFGQPEDHDMSD